MTSDRGTLYWWRLLAYIALLIGAFLLYVFKVPWQQCINSVLTYYEEFSLLFTIGICCLIPLRIFSLKQKGVVLETRRFHILGPLVAFILDPLYDAALFYSALFMLHIIFQKELSLDPLLVLLLVSGIILYESITHVFRLAREIFFAQLTEEIIAARETTTA